MLPDQGMAIWQRMGLAEQGNLLQVPSLKQQGFCGGGRVQGCMLALAVRKKQTLQI